MKKIFLISVLFAVLFSSCSNLNKISNQEIKVSIDTKPLASYAKIFFDEDTPISMGKDSEDDKPIQIPSDTPNYPEEEIPREELSSPLSDYSFTLKVTLSGDFTKDIVKEESVDFEKVISNPDKITFKFENLEYMTGSKAKLNAEVFITPKENSNITVSNSLFIAEIEHALSEGNNTIPLSMNYVNGEWPTDGILSLLPEMKDFWFYTEEKLEKNAFEWRIYNKNLNFTDEDYELYKMATGNLYEEDNYNKLLKMFNLPEESGLEFGPYFEDSCMIFTVHLYPYEEPEDPKEPEDIITYATFVYGDHSYKENVIDVPEENEFYLPNTDYNPKPGYEFSGWYLDEDFSKGPYETYKFDIANGETKRIFYAKFDAIKYLISYYTEFGNLSEDLLDEYTVENDIFLPELEYGDYTFAGWYDESNNKVTDWKAGERTGDLSLHATWKVSEEDNDDEVSITLNYVFTTQSGSFSKNDLSALKNNICAIPSELLNLSFKVIYESEDKSITGSINGNELKLPQGNYTLTISAEGSNGESLVQEIENFYVDKNNYDNSSKKIEFNHTNLTNTDLGSVNLPFDISNSKTVDYYIVSATGNQNIEDETFYLKNGSSWQQTDLMPATYTTKFEFFNAEDESECIVSSISVFVWPGFTTDTFYGPEGTVTEDNKLIVQTSTQTNTKDDNYTGSKEETIISKEDIVENENNEIITF